MTRRDAINFVIIRSIGNFLVLFSLYGVFMTFGPALYYEVLFRVVEARGVHFSVAAVPSSSQTAQASSMSFGDLLVGSANKTIIPDNTQFSIVIPKIGASAKIIPNVDPTDPNSYLPALKQGVAHAKGTVFPGMNGTVYLFAHSTDNFWDVGRYNAVFYLLKDLSKGDQITIFFENKRYDYSVTNSIIGDASDVSYLEKSHKTPQQLILQTCWPPGTTWKRIFVTAKPVQST